MRPAVIKLCDASLRAVDATLVFRLRYHKKILLITTLAL
jgi:hypothetical protein